MGIKKLDQLIIKSFIGPFIITFFIVLFVLLMQFFWLYMDDLLGKGVGLAVLAELMLYMSATLVPMALPLGILLASIMTFGNLGENFELVAIKSSGISLFRFMRPLTILVAFLSLGAFVFSNNIIPFANQKAFSLLYDIRKQKPTMSIRPGIFNKEMGDFAIRVGSKNEDGQGIGDILIYDHSTGMGNNNVVIADSGKMFLTPDNRYLIFELENGWRYEEKVNQDGVREQQRMYFGKWNKVIDLSAFSFKRNQDEMFNNNHEMMNVKELAHGIDSIQKSKDQDIKGLNKNVMQYYSLQPTSKNYNTIKAKVETEKSAVAKVNFKDNILELMNDTFVNKVLIRADGSIKSTERFSEITIATNNIKRDKNNRFEIEFHRKFTLSFSCMLLFLIGAPLGAIIRKGGLGMPVVVAVIFFVIYFIISTTGEKFAKQDKLDPLVGMWLATFVLLPIATVIMITARNDSQIFNKETYLRIWKRISGLFNKKKTV